jgi:hypothetical protein
MLTLPRPRFYVYVLARPNGKPFYVGKGCGSRVSAHDSEARRGCICRKCRMIRAIWGEGGVVSRSIIFTTDNEDEAYAYEAETIAFYGRENLTNQSAGGRHAPAARSAASKERAQARAALAKDSRIQVQRHMERWNRPLSWMKQAMTARDERDPEE